MGDLDPALAAVIEAVPSWVGLTPDVTPITIGITNRNFRVDIGGESFVVRLSGKDTELLGIDRAAENEAASTAADAGVAPEVFAYLPEHSALITRFVQGDHIPEEDLQREDVLGSVVRSVKAIHACPPVHAAFPVFRIVEDYALIAAERGVTIPDAYGEAHSMADRIEAAFSMAPTLDTTCHNDLLNANFLRDGEHVWIVDYEYAGMGDPFFDLGNLSINNGLSPDAQEMLLRLYFAEVADEHRARLGLMRIMSDFREAMWGVVQQGLSTLDFDYVEYGDKHFRRLLETAADPRFERWLRAVA
ncbi:MAG TPA: phosphotransferase [Actinomycetota bacterium]|nr:phosphotransferase [Actinomycetota bacterium]